MDVFSRCEPLLSDSSLHVDASEKQWEAYKWLPKRQVEPDAGLKPATLRLQGARSNQLSQSGK